ncbi:MAG: hypothetical protein JWN25_299, partial [Verrucomicrobiales bacterium]|nr:hypothetical protein [Verrucomicrobiales bacterium]
EMGEIMGPDLAPEFKNGITEEEIHAWREGEGKLFKGVQVLAMRTLSETNVELKIKSDFAPGMPLEKQKNYDIEIQRMVKINGAWKRTGNTYGYDPAWDGSENVQVFDSAGVAAPRAVQ